MAVIVSFIMGIAVGAAIYHWRYAEKLCSRELCCNEKDKDRELYRQLERLMAYSGKEK